LLIGAVVPIIRSSLDSGGGAEATPTTSTSTLSTASREVTQVPIPEQAVPGKSQTSTKGDGKRVDNAKSKEDGKKRVGEVEQDVTKGASGLGKTSSTKPSTKAERRALQVSLVQNYKLYGWSNLPCTIIINK
jgi:hypothetical protein